MLKVHLGKGYILILNHFKIVILLWKRTENSTCMNKDVSFPSILF